MKNKEIRFLATLGFLVLSSNTLGDNTTHPRDHSKLLRDQVSVSEDAVYSFASRLKSGEASPMEHADFKAKVVDLEARAIQALKDYEKEMQNEILPMIQFHLDHYNSIATDQSAYSLEQKKRLLENIRNDSTMKNANIQRKRLLFRTMTAVVPLPFAVTYSQAYLSEVCEYHRVEECSDAHKYGNSRVYTFGIYDGHRTHTAVRYVGNTDISLDWTDASAALDKILPSLYEESIAKDCYSRSCYLLTAQYIREWVSLIEAKLNSELTFTSEKIFNSTEDPITMRLPKSDPLENTRRVGPILENTKHRYQGIQLWKTFRDFAGVRQRIDEVNGFGPFLVPIDQMSQDYNSHWVRSFIEDDALDDMDWRDDKPRTLIDELLHSYSPPETLSFDLSEVELKEILAKQEADQKAAKKEAKLRSEAEVLNTERKDKISAMVIEIADLFSKDKGVYKLSPKKQLAHCQAVQSRHRKSICEFGAEIEENPYFESSCLSGAELRTGVNSVLKRIKAHFQRTGNFKSQLRRKRIIKRIERCI